MKRWTAWWWLLALLTLAACAPAAHTSAPTADPSSFARRLATVELPATPDDAGLRATQIAARPSPTFNAPTLAITPTIYVGTFLGVEADEPSLPVVDPALFMGSPGAPTPVAPELAACSVPVDPVFGAGWAEQAGLSAQLGCPAEPSTQAQGSSQAFERGLMVFVPSGEIWAIQPNGPYWHVPQAPDDQAWDTSAPEGLLIPSLGFGATWKASSAIRDGLGFARAHEAGGTITIQRFDRGVLLRDGASGVTYVLVGERDSGIAFGPF